MSSEVAPEVVDKLPETEGEEKKLEAPSVSAPAEVTTTATPEAQVVEPQNALTQKFTDAEWKALKEFRVRSIISLPY